MRRRPKGSRYSLLEWDIDGWGAGYSPEQLADKENLDGRRADCPLNIDTSSRVLTYKKTMKMKHVIKIKEIWIVRRYPYLSWNQDARKIPLHPSVRATSTPCLTVLTRCCQRSVLVRLPTATVDQAGSLLPRLPSDRTFA